MLTIGALIASGFGLLLLETILPGLVAGLAGLICLVFGVAQAYSDFGARTGSLVLLGVMVGLVVGAIMWIRYFPTSRMGQMFVSHKVVGDADYERPELLGQNGVAQSNLRPSGVAIIDGRRVDVVTEGPFIARGAPLKVVALEGARVIVRQKC